jgi:hypothetical protein
MPERGNFCPICGGDNSLEPEVIIDPEEIVFPDEEMKAEEVALEEDAPVEEMDEDAVSEQAEEENDAPVGTSPSLKKARFISAMTGCIAALAILAVVLFVGISGNFSEDGKGWDVGSWFSWLIPKENNVLCKDSYTVEAKKAMSRVDDA